MQGEVKGKAEGTYTKYKRIFIDDAEIDVLARPYLLGLGLG